MKTKKFVTAIIMCFALLVSSVTVFALTPSETTTTALRNAVAHDWTYNSRGYYEQNCLAHAIGDGHVWTWPWGSANPTKAQARSYLESRGYRYFLDANQAGALPSDEVYAYILNGGITHFARRNSSLATNPNITAKWGRSELFNHSTSNPYTNAVYGQLSFRFSK